jgi:hypothetical protein
MGKSTEGFPDDADLGIDLLVNNAGVMPLTPLAACMLRGNPLPRPPHRIRRGVHFTEIPCLTAALAVGNRDSVARFCHIDSDENICMLLHSSSSCDEERLGHPEQHSETQSRASHLKHRSGHTIFGSSRVRPRISRSQTR